jgi:Zn-dependent M16 (insulinase) family peptidase
MNITRNFELITDQNIPELNTRARLYRHLKTGAELLSLENDDENKVFGITFRTPPPDSTGLPHIMEHSVLCGSHKYPVREPYVELTKSSLATFINAMTFPDKTTYPVASQNVQDFYNLIDVYMDAVLHPLISSHTLEQEGWHFELDNMDGQLAYKGVVFNEMKGAYSSPDGLLSKYSQESLFPDHPYGRDSGGDPHLIPNLTYAQFKAFHDTYYHPSNARIYFYGDDDPQERLRLMGDYLKEYEAITLDSSIPMHPPFKKPRLLEFPYDPGEGEQNANKAMVTTNWVLAEGRDPQLALALGMLSHILIDTPASPLRKALIDSGLGEDLAGDGLEQHLRQASFYTGLKGVMLADAGKVEPLILDTLTKLSREGIDPDVVAAAVNTIEFRLRENNTGQFPRGLSLMFRTLTSWLYGGDPVARMAFEAPLNEIKSRVAAGERYFEGLIQTYMLDNCHRTTVVLKPEPGLAQREDAAEKERLAQARSTMDQSDLLSIVENTHALKLRQETPDSPESLATIPVLRVADLDRLNKQIPLEVLEQEGCQVLYHDLFTNGIFYLDVGFNLQALPQELLPYISLFGRAMVEMGTDTEDFVKFSLRIGRSTGGIRPATLVSSKPGKDDSAAWLFLRGKATIPQTDDLLAILHDVLHMVNLDNRERFRQMVLEEKASLEAQLVPMGHRFVNTRLRARFDQAGWVAEGIGGISYLFFLRDLARDVDEDWAGVLKKLLLMRRFLFNRQVMLCNVTLDNINWGQVKPRLEKFLASLPLSQATYANWIPQGFPPYEGLIIPAQVNYVGKGASLYQLGFDYHASWNVALNYLRATWLWERVRVQGGAYGGHCMFDHRSGVLTYYSYRDPNLLSTLANYDGAGQFLRTLDLSRSELEKSIIRTIGDMDTYMLPDARGYTSMGRYLVGETDEVRQIYRDQALAATLEDFQAFGEVLDRVKENGSVVVLGSQEAIEAAGHERPNWLEVRRVI